MISEIDNKAESANSSSTWARILHNTIASVTFNQLKLEEVGFFEPILIEFPLFSLYICILLLIETNSIIIDTVLISLIDFDLILINSFILCLIFVSFFRKTYNFKQYFNIAMYQCNLIFLFGILFKIILNFLRHTSVLGILELLTISFYSLFSRNYILNQFTEYHQKSLVFKFFFMFFLSIDFLLSGILFILRGS